MGQLNNEGNVKAALSQLLDEYSREKPVLANEGGWCYKMTSRGTAIFVHYVLMTIAKN